MLKKAIQLLVLSLAMSTVVYAADDPIQEIPKPKDFAFTIPITINNKAALYEFAIPKHVYQSTTRTDLGDMRVFNGKSEVVPHAVRQPVLRDLQSLALVEVQLYPLKGLPNQTLNQISIKVRKRSGETVVNVDDSSKKDDGLLVGYLLDTGKIDQPIKALNLSWRNDSKDFVGSIRVERSDDLQSWYTVAYKAPVAHLQYSGYQLERSKIELGNVKAKFLRISWPTGQTPIQLQAIKAELTDLVVDRPRQWQHIEATVVAEMPGEYFFDLQGPLPVDRLSVWLPQRNTMVNASLYSRQNDTEEWQLRTGGLLYNLQLDGTELKNDDFHLRPQSHRYWRLVVPQKESGLGGNLPKLRVGWLPQQLVFIARGEGPFQLAYGSVRPHVHGIDFQVDRLIDNFAAGDKLKIQKAQIGPHTELSGPAALQPAWAETVPWKQWLLWAILGLGVVLLAWMAMSLLKQMRQHPEATGTPPEEDSK